MTSEAADLRAALAAERAARTAAERAVERLSRLQAVTASLSNAPTLADVARVVMTQGLAGLGADGGALCLLVDDGRELEIAAEVNYAAEVTQAWRRFPVDAPLPAGIAVRTGEPVFITSIADRDERFPMFRDSPTVHNAFAVTPLLLSESAVGALAVSFSHERDFTEDDRAFFVTLGRQCAQAVERARLAEAQERQRAREAFLAEASRVLAASLEVESTLDQVGRLLVPSVADSSSIYLLDEIGLRLVAVSHASPDKEALMRELAAREGAYIGNELLLALARGEADELHGEATDELWQSMAEDAEHLDLLRRLDVRSGISLPLIARGRTHGVLSMTRTASRRPYDADDLEFAKDVAARVAMSISNATAIRDLRETARILQQTLLPPQTPAIPGLDVASRYHPVGEGTEIGGDFYDVFPAEEGRWGVVIGDVSGKGIDAAAITALARYTVRGLATFEVSPARALRGLNQVLNDQTDGERFCTIVQLLVEPNATGASVTFACGGHPLPALLRSDGTITLVGTPGTAIGLLADATVHDSHVELGPGDALVLYTDGVIEARRPDGTFVPDIVESVLSGLGPDVGADTIAEALAAAVIRTADGHSRDDVALLVLRVPPGVEPDEAAVPLELRLGPEPRSAALVRRRLRVWVEALDPPDPGWLPELILAVDELVTNAARVAASFIDVRATVAHDTVTVVVSDDGPGFGGRVGIASELDPEAESGRGLYIARAVVDELAIEPAADGATVTIRKHLARSG